MHLLWTGNPIGIFVYIVWAIFSFFLALGVTSPVYDSRGKAWPQQTTTEWAGDMMKVWLISMIICLVIVNVISFFASNSQLPAATMKGYHVAIRDLMISCIPNT